MICEIPTKHDYNHFYILDFLKYFNYHDCKVVKFISSIYGNISVSKLGKVWIKQTGSRKKKSVAINRKIPIAIVEYNKNMNGVDRLNQSIKNIGLKRNTKKWTNKLSMYLLSCIIHNSYILWKPVSTVKKNKNEFIFELFNKLSEIKTEPTKVMHFCGTKKPVVNAFSVPKKK